MKKALLYLTLIAIACYRLQAQTTIDLTGLTSAQGITVAGVADTSYGEVSYAGDVNADGLYDVLVYTDFNLYLIYGTTSGAAEIDLTNFTTSQGFMISGSSDYAFSGTGDVNGDNIDDLLVTNIYETSVCVIFGSKTGLQNMNLTDCGSSSTTAQITGCTPDYTYCSLGTTVGGAGDVNGDGLQDMLIVAYEAGPSSREFAGVAYVIFGQDGLSNTNITNLTSAQGFSILGPAFSAYFGERASQAGDVNGDGIDDLIIAGYFGYPIYVIYGSTGISDIDLSNFDSSQGYTIYVQNYEMQVTALSNAGDVNGDGIDDMLIGLQNNTFALAYVLYGTKNILSNVVLRDISPSDGFSILSHETSSFAAYASGIGDFNQDGLDDVVISASNDDNGAGAAYVILGTKSQPASITVDSLTSTQGLAIIGPDGENVGFTVSGVGDFNGDNYPDIALGTRSDFAAGYVVYSPYSGSVPNPSPTPTPTPDPNPNPNPSPNPNPNPNPNPTPTPTPDYNPPNSNPKSGERIGSTALFAIITAFILSML